MGQGMSGEQFDVLCSIAGKGGTADVLAAIDLDPKLATRAHGKGLLSGNGLTLLIHTCRGSHDNPQLVQGLLERGAKVHAQANDGWDALMCASSKGHLKVCLLLISMRANLMLVVNGRNSLDRYGRQSSLTSVEKKQGRAVLRAAFGIERRWARRWPVLNVMAGCGFRPLVTQLLQLDLQRDALYARGELPPLIILDTQERRRSYLMGQVFGNEGLLRLVVLFL